MLTYRTQSIRELSAATGPVNFLVGQAKPGKPTHQRESSFSAIGNPEKTTYRPGGRFRK
jgi:hypothetical protein